MTVYRLVWRTWWAGLALCLALTGLVVGSVGAVLVTTVLSGLIATVTAAALLQNDGGIRVPVPQHHRVATRFGLRVGAAAGILSAGSAVVGSLVLPLAVAAALTSPPVVTVLVAGNWHRRSAGMVPVKQGCRCGCADPVSAEEMRVLLGLLSDAELARAWRQSFTRLQRARSVTEWSGLVNLRIACLAELEDRDPPAVRRWLDSRPTAATAPDLSETPPAG